MPTFIFYKNGIKVNPGVLFVYLFVWICFDHMQYKSRKNELWSKKKKKKTLAPNPLKIKWSDRYNNETFSNANKDANGIARSRSLARVLLTLSPPPPFPSAHILLHKQIASQD